MNSSAEKLFVVESDDGLRSLIGFTSFLLAARTEATRMFCTMQS